MAIHGKRASSCSAKELVCTSPVCHSASSPINHSACFIPFMLSVHQTTEAFLEQKTRVRWLFELFWFEKYCKSELWEKKSTILRKDSLLQLLPLPSYTCHTLIYHQWIILHILFIKFLILSPPMHKQLKKCDPNMTGLPGTACYKWTLCDSKQYCRLCNDKTCWHRHSCTNSTAD